MADDLFLTHWNRIPGKPVFKTVGGYSIFGSGDIPVTPSIGSTSGLPVLTGASGVLTTGTLNGTGNISATSDVVFIDPTTNTLSITPLSGNASIRFNAPGSITRGFLKTTNTNEFEFKNSNDTTFANISAGEVKLSSIKYHEVGSDLNYYSDYHVFNNYNNSALGEVYAGLLDGNQITSRDATIRNDIINPILKVVCSGDGLTTFGVYASSASGKYSVFRGTGLHVQDETGMSNKVSIDPTNGIRITSGLGLQLSNSTANTTSIDSGLFRRDANGLEVNNGTAGTLRDLTLRQLTINRASHSSYGIYACGQNSNGYKDWELNEGQLANYGGSLTLRDGLLAQTGYVRLLYSAGFPKLESTTNNLTFMTSTNRMRLTNAYIDMGGTNDSTQWLYLTGTLNKSRAANGFESRNLADTDYAPFAASTIIANSWIRSANYVSIGGGTGTNSYIYGPASGQISLYNNPQTSGVGLDFTADGVLKVRNKAQSAFANIESGTITSQFRTLSADPTTLDISSGFSQIVKNTTSGEINLWSNDGGVMKSISGGGGGSGISQARAMSLITANHLIAI